MILAIYVLSLLALYAGALLPSPALFLIALAAVVIVERWGIKRTALAGLMRRAQLSGVTRSLIRDGAILTMVAHSALSFGLILLYALRALINVELRRIHELRQLPHPTRNLDLSGLGIPDAPPSWLTGRAPAWLLHLALPVAVGAAISTGAATAGLVVSTMCVLTVLGAAAIHHHRNLVLADKEALQAAALTQLREYRPEVLLYFSLSEASGTTYQVDSWLGVLAGLRHRAAILVRERKHLTRIAPTTLPIICVPRGPDVMDLDLPDLKAVLYVGNTGNNIQMLRTNGVRHVFVGHGDSDKVASTNPFSRVYDEVWVAGRAGRDRYSRAGSAVADSSIVEVGRPQLAAVEPARTDRRVFTVLYAPTWEGWSTDLAVSSVPVMGLTIVKTLLALSPDIRIIYKPHPLTGYQDPVTKRVNQKIIDLLGDSGHASERLTELDRLIAELAGPESPDDAQATRDHGTPSPERHARLIEAEREWQRLSWEGSAHRTVTGPRPDLYSCFNQADLMIADISAVVSDFVASGKPYVVTNVRDQDEDEFRAAQTVAGGAYLLGSDAAGLAGLVRALRQPVPDDPMAERRERLRHYLLGPGTPAPMDRFNDAVDAVIAKPYPAGLPVLAS
ncbi:CDP-glycerol glycerophosphotransferase family protein [Actinoplanes sp. CA-015351]|uniref:CDP-glycerol glycerophosphotransferase family protein n=1 Tax=Actinoplanes sp. CA-015351 TaxID=3239897 RepID=UPI003D99A115